MDKFEAFELKITITNEHELLDLWHRLNVAHVKIYSNSFDYFKFCKYKSPVHYKTNLVSRRLWEQLDKEFTKYDDSFRKRPI